MSADDGVDAIRDRYAHAATRIQASGSSGLIDDNECGIYGASQYGDVDGLPTDIIAASLGCGNPTVVADLQPGDTVLDLGSGAGLDVLLSATRVAPTGHAIGLDMTDQMVDLARENARRAGVTNVEFLRGRIESIPLPDASVDVVISNCVITLSADKSAVFREIVRVLRPGGRIGISDVLAEDSLTAQERAAGAGNVEALSSSLTADDYRAMLADVGLVGVSVTKTHPTGQKLFAAIVQARKPRN